MTAAFKLWSRTLNIAGRAVIFVFSASSSSEKFTEHNYVGCCSTSCFEKVLLFSMSFQYLIGNERFMLILIGNDL
jgi:hypothetical protein